MSWKKTSYTVAGKSGFKHTPKNWLLCSVYEFHRETTENCAHEGLFEDPFFGTLKQILKKSILDDRISRKTGPEMFLQIILELKRLLSEMFEFKHRSFGQRSYGHNL